MSLPNIRYIFARALSKRPAAVRGTKIDSRAAVGDGAVLINSSVGRYSYVYGSSLIETEMGSFCSVGSGCVVGGGRHPTNWVSSSPVFYNKGNVLKKNFSNQRFDEYVKTVIGNDVWIGSRVFVKGGVTIGHGAIIGMGSVVTHDIPPYEIWAGNPAHCIRKRFDEDTIKKLLELRWWDWDEEKLKKYGDYFCDPKELLKQLENET